MNSPFETLIETSDAGLTPMPSSACLDFSWTNGRVCGFWAPLLLAVVQPLQEYLVASCRTVTAELSFETASACLSS